MLHDEVILEDGVYEVTIGPQGGSGWWHPQHYPEVRKWQSARERGQIEGQNFWFSVTPTGSSGPGHYLVPPTPASIAWRATLEPIKAELGRGYDWLFFGGAYDTDLGQLKQQVETWAWREEQDLYLKQMLPEHFVRSTVTKNANLDLAIAAHIFNAAVSMEKLHRKVITARLQRGHAQVVFGHYALEVILPAVGDFSWDEVDEARRHKDIRYLRDILREVEAAAWDSASSQADLERKTNQEFRTRLLEAKDRISGSFSRKLLLTGMGMAIGEVVGQAFTGIPVWGGAAGTALGGASDLAIEKVVAEFRRPKWLAAYEDMRKRTL